MLLKLNERTNLINVFYTGDFYQNTDYFIIILFIWLMGVDFMSGLLIVYLTGLLLGGALFALMFYFSKEMDNLKRNAILLGLGVLAVVGGLWFGDFEGMPISLIGVGIFTLPLLLLIGGKRPLGRKFFVIAVLLPMVVFSYTALATLMIPILS